MAEEDKRERVLAGKEEPEAGAAYPFEFWLGRGLAKLRATSGREERDDPAQQELRMWAQVARSKRIKGWAVGEEVTEDAFREGIEAAKNHNPNNPENW